MRKAWMIGVVAVSLVCGGAARAATVFSTDFGAENGGASALNYDRFNGLGVSFGTVDLVRGGDFGVECAGGAGSCVDLDGSTFDGGRLTSSAIYSFLEGDVITLTFDISGNQRVPGADDYNAGFNFGSTTTLNDFTRLEGADTFNFGTLVIDGQLSASFVPVAQDDPFVTRGLRFTAGNAGTLRFFVETVASNDGFGPILDNLALDVTAPAAVPEPASWAMMIGGFGLVGGALRRSRPRRMAAC